MNVRVDLRVTVRQETGVGGLTLQNVENLFTGDGWDQVTGNTENNVISTGLGNDTLEGGLGDDDLRGGDGNDTAIFSGSTRATVDLRLQGQAQNTGYGFDTLSGIESLVGGAGDDVFWGTDAANLLAGSGGNDTFVGRWRRRHAGRRDRHQHGSVRRCEGRLSGHANRRGRDRSWPRRHGCRAQCALPPVRRWRDRADQCGPDGSRTLRSRHRGERAAWFRGRDALGFGCGRRRRHLQPCRRQPLCRRRQQSRGRRHSRFRGRSPA